MSATVSMATDCFGFYGGETHVACSVCPAHPRCKAVLVTDTFPMIGELIDDLLMRLPEGAMFKDTQMIPEIVDQLLSPPTVVELSKEEAELMNLVGAESMKNTNALSTDDI